MSRALKAPAASDMRVGVTQAEHDALDIVADLRSWAFDHVNVDSLLGSAVDGAKQACRALPKSPATLRMSALLAAAHLIRAVELQDAAL
jgi:hypothetical protein